MKNLLKIISLTAVAIPLMTSGVTVHAETINAPQAIHDMTLAFAFPVFKLNISNRIKSDQANVIKNRDTRNALLLEAKQGSTSISEATPSASSTEETTTLHDLSLSISNLKNIQSRIDLRVIAVANNGNDVTDITNTMSKAAMQLDLASTTLESVVHPASTTDATTTMTFASSTEVIDQALTGAKGFLEQALDELKAIVKN